MQIVDNNYDYISIEQVCIMYLGFVCRNESSTKTFSIEKFLCSKTFSLKILFESSYLSKIIPKGLSKVTTSVRNFSHEKDF